MSFFGKSSSERAAANPGCRPVWRWGCSWWVQFRWALVVVGPVFAAPQAAAWGADARKSPGRGLSASGPERLLGGGRTRMASDACLLGDGTLLLASEWMLSDSLRRVNVRRCVRTKRRWVCGPRRYLPLRRAVHGQSDPSLVCPPWSGRAKAPYAVEPVLFVREGDLRRGRGEVVAFRVKLPGVGGTRSIRSRLAVRRIGGLGLPAVVRSAADCRPFARRGPEGRIWLTVTARRAGGGDHCWLSVSSGGGRFSLFSGKPAATGSACAAVRVARNLWALSYHGKIRAKAAVRAMYRWSSDGRTWSAPRRLMAGEISSAYAVPVAMADGSVRFFVEAQVPGGTTVAEVAFPVSAPFPAQRLLLAADRLRRLRPTALVTAGLKPGVRVIYARELGRLRFELRTLEVP